MPYPYFTLRPNCYAAAKHSSDCASRVPCVCWIFPTAFFLCDHSDTI
uniref:Uncharacterized protein n=1 Tax=Anguilla anguilla TaxID=7936 RepID=A0A0E9W366_ANGAN